MTELQQSLIDFIERIGDAFGPYRYLDGTQIVADAYKVLADYRVQQTLDAAAVHLPDNLRQGEISVWWDCLEHDSWHNGCSSCVTRARVLSKVLDAIKEKWHDPKLHDPDDIAKAAIEAYESSKPMPVFGEPDIETRRYHYNQGWNDAKAEQPVESTSCFNCGSEMGDDGCEKCAKDLAVYLNDKYQTNAELVAFEDGYEVGLKVAPLKRESGERIHQEEILSGLIYHAILENPGIMEARDAVLTIIRPHLPKEGELPKRNETVALTSHAHAIIGFIESLEDIEGDIPEEWGVALRGYAKRLEAALSKIEVQPTREK